MNREFQLRYIHIKLIKNLKVTYEDCGWFKCPKVDHIRPFGSTDIAQDIRDLLGWEDTLENAYRVTELAKELPTAVAIVLGNGNTVLGTYSTEENDNNWKLDMRIMG